MKEQSKRILLVLRQGYISTLNGESNDKDPKFEVDDDVRIWKYKNIFKKHLQKQSKNIYTPNCSEEVFVMKKVTNSEVKSYSSLCMWKVNYTCIIMQQNLE